MAKVERFVKRIVEVIQPDDVVLAEATGRSQGQYHIHLSEVDDKKGERFVRLTDVPESLIAVKLDSFDLNRAFVQTGGGKPYGRRCDYLLVDPINHLLTFIELKLGTTGGHAKDVVLQLKGGRAIADYMASLMRHFDGVDIDLAGVETRFLWITFQQSNSDQFKRGSQFKADDVDDPRKLSQGRNGSINYRAVIL